MIFFTSNIVKSSNYSIDGIDKRRKYDKLVYFIEPCVRQLLHAREYTHINKLHSKVKYLNENEYITIDYPCDMNVMYSDEFIQKSIDNNYKYADIDNYICVVQSKFQDYFDFMRQFKNLEKIWIENKNKIIGIGNLCRIKHPNTFTDLVFSYLKRANSLKGRRVHIYGLSIKLIKKYANYIEDAGIKMSTDSNKWLYRVHTNYPLTDPYCCNNHDVYFLEYIKEIKKYVNNVIY